MKFYTRGCIGEDKRKTKNSLDVLYKGKVSDDFTIVIRGLDFITNVLEANMYN